jgi:ABC-type uncharacterized transport system substrate-binding protein
VGVLAQDLQPGLLDTLRSELSKLGYLENAGLSIEVRNADGQNERLKGLVQELLRVKVDVIVAVNTPAAQAAKKATETVPIVMMRVADPVKSGLVASLARPGGNVTGLSFMPDALGPKGSNSSMTCFHRSRGSLHFIAATIRARSLLLMRSNRRAGGSD